MIEFAYDHSKKPLPIFWRDSEIHHFLYKKLEHFDGEYAYKLRQSIPEYFNTNYVGFDEYVRRVYLFLHVQRFLLPKGIKEEFDAYLAELLLDA